MKDYESIQTIDLAGKVAVDLAFDGTRYRGIAGARRDGRVFLAPGRGYSITIEGMCQLGVSSWGNLRPEAIAGKQELLLNTSFRYFVKDWRGNPAINCDSYLRSLAAHAPFAVWCEEFLGHAEPFPLPLPEWFASMTNAFNVVEPRMRRRKLLPEGALWYDADGRPAAWFAFRDGATHADLLASGWIPLVGAGVASAGSICQRKN